MTATAYVTLKTMKGIREMNRLLRVLSFCLLFCAHEGIRAEESGSGATLQRAADYKVTPVRIASIKTTEYRLFYRDSHFLTVILDGNGAIAIRPHPGNDVNGWGSTWYPEPFLPGATLRKSAVSSKTTATNIIVKVSGIVSKGVRDSFGTWTMALSFGFDPTAKRISASGTYAVKLKDSLSEITGDLNICRIASNYLTDVPLLDGTTGDTGDMSYVKVTDDFGSYGWTPPEQPAFFPQDPNSNLIIDVEGQYNNVDTVAQVFAAIAPAYKPTLQVSYSLQLPVCSVDVGHYFPQTLLSDNITGSSMSGSMWSIPTWVSPADGTFLGRTQFRCTQKARLPAVKNGSAKILLETYNPTGFSLYGTDVFVKRSIALGQGVLVTVVAKADSPFPRGIVGGIFLYALKSGSDTIHNEIDFELLSNQPNYVQTNIYGDEPLGTGHPTSLPFPSGAATDYHTYQILWLQDQVSWYVDSTLIRTVTTQSPIPAGPMYLHVNMWAPDSDWAEAYDASLQPTKTARANQAYSLLVDSVKVESLEPPPMIFGAIYDENSSKLYYSDNVGITPLILQSSTLKSLNFHVEFQSEALPGDD